MKEITLTKDECKALAGMIKVLVLVHGHKKTPIEKDVTNKVFDYAYPNARKTRPNGKMKRGRPIGSKNKPDNTWGDSPCPQWKRDDTWDACSKCKPKKAPNWVFCNNRDTKKFPATEPKRKRGRPRKGVDWLTSIAHKVDRATKVVDKQKNKRGRPKKYKSLVIKDFNKKDVPTKKYSVYCKFCGTVIRIRGPHLRGRMGKRYGICKKC